MTQRSVLQLVIIASIPWVLASSVAYVRAQPPAPDEAIVVDGLMWSGATTGSVPWSEADEFCDTLETDGYTDWRLPTLFELEALHAPEAARSIRLPFELTDCCAWSSMNLVALEADLKGRLPEPGGPPAEYYWGYLFDGGISYYSNGRFPDGLALCVRTP